MKRLALILSLLLALPAYAVDSVWIDRDNVTTSAEISTIAATPAQGAKADSALQPASPVTTGNATVGGAPSYPDDTEIKDATWGYSYNAKMGQGTNGTPATGQQATFYAEKYLGYNGTTADLARGAGHFRTIKKSGAANSSGLMSSFKLDGGSGDTSNLFLHSVLTSPLTASPAGSFYGMWNYVRNQGGAGSGHSTNMELDLSEGTAGDAGHHTDLGSATNDNLSNHIWMSNIGPEGSHLTEAIGMIGGLGYGKYHSGFYVGIDSIVPTDGNGKNEVFFLRGGSTSGNAASILRTGADYFTNGIDLSAGTFSGDAIKLAAGQTINGYTVADLASGGASVSDTAYGAGWNGDTTTAPSKNAVYDKIEAIVAGSGSVSDAAYDSSWDGDTTNSPSKNVVYDKVETLAPKDSPSLTGAVGMKGPSTDSGSVTATVTLGATSLTLSGAGMNLAVGDIVALDSLTSNPYKIATKTNDTTYTITSNASSTLTSEFTAYKPSLRIVNAADAAYITAQEAGLTRLSVGHDASVNNYSAHLSVAGATSSLFKAINTTTSSATQGSGLQVFQDDGAATEAGHRLGFLIFGGASDTSHTLLNAASVEAYATSTFSGSNGESYLSFKTTPSGSTTRTEKMKLDGAGNLTLNSVPVLGTTVELMDVSSAADSFTFPALTGRVAPVVILMIGTTDATKTATLTAPADGGLTIQVSGGSHTAAANGSVVYDNATPMPSGAQITCYPRTSGTVQWRCIRATGQ